MDDTKQEETILTVTPEAVQAMRDTLKEHGMVDNFSLRFSVVGGGCSGYQYNIDIDSEERMGDTSLKFEDVTIIIDSISAGYLKGTTVDYKKTLQGAGFVFKNPNAKRTCGCGSSFS